MPVSSSSWEGDSSSNFGALAWIGRFSSRWHGTGFVDRATEHVHDAAEGAVADRNRDRGAGGLDRHAAAQAVGRSHRDGADDAVAELLLDLEGQAGLGVAEIGIVEVRAS